MMNMLSRYNPDYIRQCAENHALAKKMMLTEVSLLTMFKGKGWARRWVMLQVSRVIELADVPAAKIEEVELIADSICALYGSKSFGQISVFFGLAQTGHKYNSIGEIVHYGKFSVNNLCVQLGKFIEENRDRVNRELDINRYRNERDEYRMQIATGQAIGIAEYLADPRIPEENKCNLRQFESVINKTNKK